MVSFQSFGTVSYSHSIVIMALPCIISEIKRDIGRKLRFVHTLHSTPPLGGSQSDCCRTVSCGNGEESLMIRLAVSTKYRRVTDRLTDGRTSCDSIYSALCIASRGKNHKLTAIGGFSNLSNIQHTI